MRPYALMEGERSLVKQSTKMILAALVAIVAVSLAVFSVARVMKPKPEFTADKLDKMYGPTAPR